MWFTSAAMVSVSYADGRKRVFCTNRAKENVVVSRKWQSCSL